MERLVDVERDSLFDFVIYSETGALEAVGEMKRWMTTTGEPEVPLIQKDIDKIIRRNLRRGNLRRKRPFASLIFTLCRSITNLLNKPTSS